nr:MAG TPA: hypothetical protein [Caudoviricetes sp.]
MDIKKGERHFTIGKVYDVVNGEITNDHGHTYSDTRCKQDVVEFLSSWYTFKRVDNDFVISRVIFNGPATIILWTDGIKTIAKTHGDDAFDPEKGFAVACAKKLLGNGNAFRMELAKWIPAEDKRPNIEKFKVGDRVEYLGHPGTVIALVDRGGGIRQLESNLMKLASVAIIAAELSSRTDAKGARTIANG